MYLSETNYLNRCKLKFYYITEPRELNSYVLINLVIPTFNFLIF